jgi:hypothetical protein
MALDLSKATTATPPPKRAAKSTVARKAVASIKTSEREEALNGLFQLGAAGCLMFGSSADAAAIAQHAPNISRETAGIAETNETFGKYLDYITAIGPYAGLLTAVMPLVLQILVNHKRLPAEPLAGFGVVSPETLNAKMQAEAMQMEMELRQQAQAAEHEAARIQSQMANA